jgi:general secretion pathway protein F
MALFSYQAINDKGKKITGVIDADSYLIAKERLLKQEIMITRLSLLETKKKEWSLDPTLLLSFTRELGQLLQAGLPLYDCLVTIEEKYRHHKSHPLFLDLCDCLKVGHPLSFALKKYPKTFDPIYLSMVQAAEKTASLASIFQQLCTLLSRQQKLKKQLTSALIYPSFLGGFCFLLIIGLLYFVIPSLQGLFEGRNLHPMTSIVLSLSKFANENTYALLFSFVFLILSMAALFRRKETRLFFQKQILKVPFFKTIMVQSALIRFCRSSSLLLQGGIPLIEALSLARASMKNSLLEEAVANTEKKIAEGETLSSQLKRSPLVPNLVIRMLSIAEETGKMSPMLQNISDIYDEELERNLAQLTTYVQPLLLLILGGIVGIVLLSILLPLTDVSSFTSS